MENQNDITTIDYLITIRPIQNSFVKEIPIPILNLPGGTITINGNIVKNDTSVGSDSLANKVVEITATQGETVIYHSLVKPTSDGKFYANFYPPMTQVTTISANLVGDSSTKETISVSVTEALWPLIFIAILVAVSIFILIIIWAKRLFTSGRTKQSLAVGLLFVVAILMISAFSILSLFPAYYAEGLSTISLALITPIVAFLVMLIQNKFFPKIGG